MLLLAGTLAGAVLIVGALWLLPAHRLNKLFGVCVNNLRSIDGARQMWAFEHQNTTNNLALTLDDLKAYIGRGSNGLMPECPCGGLYTPGRLDEPAKCSLTEKEHTYARREARDTRQ